MNTIDKLKTYLNVILSAQSLTQAKDEARLALQVIAKSKEDAGAKAPKGRG